MITLIIENLYHSLTIPGDHDFPATVWEIARYIKNSKKSYTVKIILTNKDRNTLTSKYNLLIQLGTNISENWDCTSLSNLYHFLQFELCFNHFIFLESELTELLKSFPYPLNIGLNITNYSGNFNLSKHIYDNVVFFVITKIHE